MAVSLYLGLTKSASSAFASARDAARSSSSCCWPRAASALLAGKSAHHSAVKPPPPPIGFKPEPESAFVTGAVSASAFTGAGEVSVAAALVSTALDVTPLKSSMYVLSKAFWPWEKTSPYKTLPVPSLSARGYDAILSVSLFGLLLFLAPRSIRCALK